MPSHSPESEIGSFIPTTDVYDVDTIYEMDVKSQDFKDFLVRLRQSINNVAMVLNIKDTGYYPLETEFVCSKSYFPDPALGVSTAQKPILRQVFRKNFLFGQLPNTGTIQLAHGITINATYPVRFTDIFGTANDIATFNYISLPYADAANQNIELRVDQNNIYITTTSDRTNFSSAFVTLEYIKQ